MRPSCCRVPALGAIVGATLFLSATAQEAPRPQVLIKAGRLLDPKAGTVLANQAILVEGDRVKETGPAATVAGHAAAGARVIDLGAATVLPGLIDCHTHITSDPGDYYEQLFRRSPIDEAVVAHVYARRTLEAGFTTIRNVGADEFVDVALRTAIDRGDVAGPRMQVSTMPLSATGGHGDVNGFSPYLRFEQFSGIANGVDEIRSKVRWEIKYGADLIKVLASAGVLSEEESVGAPQYSQEELNALVAEAAMWGKKVAAHAHGAEAIKRAVRAGVASIEHGSLLDDEGIRLMKEKGTYLVADVYNDDYIIAEYARLGYPQKTIDKERQVGRAQRENFQRAVRAGVKIAFGTDAGVYPHGLKPEQFAHMVRLAQANPPPRQTLVKAGRLIDGRSDAPQANVGILVEGDRIVAVGPLAQVQGQAKNATVVDLAAMTVLPGLIDAHTHLLLQGDPTSESYDQQLLYQSTPYRAILAARNARIALEHGFTAIRDLETEGAMYADVDVKLAVSRGEIPGPRIFPAPRAMAPTGMYPIVGTNWELELPHGVQPVDGKDARAGNLTP